MHVLLLYASVLWDPERMVTAFDDEQICAGSELADNRLQLGGRPEGITGALNKQHRSVHVSQVGRAQPIAPAGRVQRITEEDQPGQLADIARGDLRCDTPAHRLTADRQLTGG